MEPHTTIDFYVDGDELNPLSPSEVFVSDVESLDIDDATFYANGNRICVLLPCQQGQLHHIVIKGDLFRALTDIAGLDDFKLCTSDQLSDLADVLKEAMEEVEEEKARRSSLERIYQMIYTRSRS